MKRVNNDKIGGSQLEFTDGHHAFHDFILIVLESQIILSPTRVGSSEKIESM